MFTKLKSDVYLRFETQGQDILKSATKIREIIKAVDEVTSYISLINELLTLLLCVEIQQAYRDEPPAS